VKKASKTQAKTKKKSGGLPARKSPVADHVHSGDDIDGCEIDFTTMEATPDTALPAAIGGVAAGGRSRGKRASARS